MPPKKKVEEEKVVLLGRLGTNLKIGIVGLPNVGKSTFFNVLTKTSIAAAENFPFCTIDPNESRVPVPDARFDFLVEHHKPASKVPAFLNVTDIVEERKIVPAVEVAEQHVICVIKKTYIWIRYVLCILW